MAAPENTETTTTNKVMSLVWLWIARIGLWTVALFVILAVILQLPPVQNRIAQYVAKVLSKELDTRVELDYVYFAYLDRMVLRGFYVQDYQGDTLLYSGKLQADFVMNPFILFSKGLIIDEIRLSDAHFNLRKIPPSNKNNLELLLEKLVPAKPRARANKPFQLDIRNIYLEEVSFSNDDKVKGQRLYFALGRGYLQFKKLDLPGKKLELKSVDLRDPIFKIDDFPAIPISVNTAVANIDSTEMDTTSTLITMEELVVHNGIFSLHNYSKAPVKTTPSDELDYKHLEVNNINLDFHNFQFAQETFRAEVRNLALQESSGFILNELSSKEVVVNSRQAALYGMKLVTPYTQLGDTLIFKYRNYESFGNFNDDVIMEAHINNSAVALSDIMVFAPGLKQNTFFNNNRAEIVKLSGEVRGKVNNLRVRDLDLRLSDGSLVQGNFSSRNLAVKNEEILNLRLDRLVTRARTLRDLIPGITLSSNFDRLGRLSFQGSFDGFFADFVAYGDLNTDIGRAVMDMRMNLKNGAGKAGYAGKLSLRNFDLGKWTGNADFGQVTFTSEVKDGRGLRAQTARARLIAEIQSFKFKNYDYKNAKLNGELNRNLFDGTFAIQDNNIDFAFRGLLNYKDSLPVFDFQANVNKIDLKKLNLSEKDLILSGVIDLNLRDDKFSTMEGEVRVNNLKLTYNRKEEYAIQYLEAMSYFDNTGDKVFQVQSDAMTANLKGKFDIEQIPNVLLQYLQRNYPAFSSRMGIKNNNKKLNSADFTYDILIKDSRGLNRILDEKLGKLENVHAVGVYNSYKDSLVIGLDVPSMQYAGVRVRDAAVTINLVKNEGWMDFLVSETVINEKQTLEPITVLGFMNGDTLSFGINYYSSGVLDNLTLEGAFFPVDTNLFQVRFKQSNLVILEMPWQIDPGNAITFGKNYIQANNFTLQSKERKLVLETIDNKGLKLDINNFNFSIIDELWDDDNLEFGGTFNLTAGVKDLFKMEDIKVRAFSDTLLVNNCNIGKLDANITVKDVKSPMWMDIAIRDGIAALTAKGKYNLADLSTPKNDALLPTDQARRYLDLAVNFTRFPLCVGESFVKSVFSQVEGYIEGNLHITSTAGKPNIAGELAIGDGILAVDYLKTNYSFSKGIIKVDNFLFDASGIVLKDKFGHTAQIQGGIRHNHLKNLGIDVRIRTPRFLVLDTQKGDNPLFYGQAIAQGDVRFNGPFNKIDIYINASANDSARIVIPISSSSNATKLQFIQFVEKHKKTETNLQGNGTRRELNGVSLEMNINIREEAQVELVFNEQTGDVIKGNGRGNIRILMPRGGAFQMFGDYTIEQGDYLFTLYNVVNKSFRVRKGGYIQWSGDPLGAQINLEAEYKGLNTSVANFIQEYLTNTTSNIKTNASQATDVVLIMHLQGDLRKPIINFDIEFPSLTGELKTYTDSKLRILKQDPNELNRQVFGLIVVGQFLPTDFALQGSEIIYNTVSEFVSNQLSLLLTELFSDLIADGRVLSGIDLDVAYNQYQSVDLGVGQNFNRGDEFQVQLRQNFFNDRLSVLVGGNLDIGSNVRNAAAAGTFFGNDVVIEYVLNKDRSLKLRVYQRSQPDIGGGRRLQVGTGISFRKEFDSFGEFWRSLRGEAKKLKKSN